jgi:hypothetical protein
MATNYIPNVKNITAITKAKNAVVTTDGDHNFLKGNSVRFDIPSEFGMREISGMTAFVISVTADTFTVDLNTKEYTTFSVPASYFQPAQAIPLGDINWGFPIQGTVPTPVGIAGSFRITRT